VRNSHKQDKEKADTIPKGTDYQHRFRGFDRRYGKKSIAYKILLAWRMGQAITQTESVHYETSLDTGTLSLD